MPQHIQRSIKQLTLTVTIPPLSEVHIQEVSFIIEDAIKRAMDEVSSYYKTTYTFEWMEK